MRPGGGKQKGAQFEREVCEQLSRWVSCGKSDSEFWRSAMSGGRATVRFAKGKSADGHGGDISATGGLGHALLSHFVIECKHVADLNLRAAVVKGIGPVREFWEQVSGDADRVGKQPMLIAKQNLMPTLLFLRSSTAQPFFGQVSQLEYVRFYRLDSYRVSMFLFAEFLECLPYEKDRFAIKATTGCARPAAIAERQDQGVKRIFCKRK